jgi:hypothetical protein
MVPTIEENHISETIKIQDNYGLDYSLKVLHTYNDDQTLFSIIINLVRNKRNKNVGQANLLFESNNDALIGDLIIYDYSSYLSINDKFYSLFNWNEPNNYQRRGLGTKILKYLIETAKLKGVKTLHTSLTEQDISNNTNLIGTKSTVLKLSHQLRTKLIVQFIEPVYTLINN